jgi:hypothetical protein
MISAGDLPFVPSQFSRLTLVEDLRGWQEVQIRSKKSREKLIRKSQKTGTQ